MFKQFILNNWQDLIGREKPQEIDIAIISSCDEVYGNDLVLIFADKTNNPQFVLKVARNCQYNFKLKRENFALLKLNEVSSVGDCVPLSLSSGVINDRYFFIQEGVCGKNLENLLQTRGLSKKTMSLINQSLLLLCSINKAQPNDTVGNNIYNDLDFSELMLKSQEFALLGVEDWYFHTILESYEKIANLGKQYFLHGDFWPANILVDDKKNKVNGIIDWEFSNPCSTVPADIMWFLITLSQSVYGYNYSQISLFDSFKWGFYTEGEHNSVFLKYFQIYMSQMGICEKKMFKPLMLLSLASMSMREKNAYGIHNTMDNECLKLLKFALMNDSYMDCI